MFINTRKVITRYRKQIGAPDTRLEDSNEPPGNTDRPPTLRARWRVHWLWRLQLVFTALTTPSGALRQAPPRTSPRNTMATETAEWAEALKSAPTFTDMVVGDTAEAWRVSRAAPAVFGIHSLHPTPRSPAPLRAESRERV